MGDCRGAARSSIFDRKYMESDPEHRNHQPGNHAGADPSVQTGIPALNSVINPVIGSSLAPAPGASANPLQIWISVFTAVWIAGAALLLLYSAVSYGRLRWRLREAVRLQGRIYQSENVHSPFLFGIIQPKIYLPYHMESRDQCHVIAHEQAHLRRGDHIWKPLGFLLLTIHWFNPV